MDDPVNAVDPEGLKKKDVKAIEKATKVGKAYDALNKASGVAKMTKEVIKANEKLNKLHQAWENATSGADTSQWDWKYLDGDHTEKETDAVVRSGGKVIEAGSSIAH